MKRKEEKETENNKSWQTQFSEEPESIKKMEEQIIQYRDGKNTCLEEKEMMI